MKIALISEEFLPQRTGVSINLMKKLKIFNQLGIQVRVYCPDYSILADTYPDYKDFQGQILEHITIVPFPSLAASLGEYNSVTVDPKPFSIKEVENDIIVFKPDLIHVDSPERLFFGFLAIPGKKAAKKLNIPLVSFYRTHFTLVLPKFKQFIWWTAIPGAIPILHRVMTWVYKNYPLVLTASKDTQEQLRNWNVPNVRQEKLIGVELEKFTPKDFSVKSEKPINIINVGRYDPDKNVSTLLEICSAINKQNPHCHFTFVGHGVEVNLVEAWTAQHPNATFVGSVSNHETAQYYRQADIFITAAEHETFGTTLIEAASCGLALVGLKAGAVIDRIIDGENGYLIPVGNIDLYAAKVTALIEDEDLRLSFSKRSIEIAQQYENKATTHNLIDIWKEVIGE